MHETIRLGHVVGVRVGVNWSVLVIFAIIALALAAGRLPLVYPDQPLWAYWIAGILTALVFFASLLAHELGHAIVARRNGIPVEGITLWLLGGVARMREEAGDPATEMRITGIGPLVSLLLGLGFGLLAVVLGVLLGPGLVVESVLWLAFINVLLAVFNVIPAAPLDGGRLLRALLWWYTGERVRSSVWAANAGRIFGWLLVAAGLVLMIVGVPLSGVWIALIGFFLIMAATAEARHSEVRGLLGGVPVRAAMSREPVTAPGQTTVAEFLDGSLFRYRHSAFPVTNENGDVIGLVGIHQVGSVAPNERSRTTLAEVMHPLADVVTVDAEEPLTDVLGRLEAGPGHRAIVFEGSRLLGIVTPSDVSRMLSWLSSISSAQYPSREEPAQPSPGT